MLHENAFKGHIDTRDPRDILWGAGGCNFPTVPAFRYSLWSEDATGDWGFLRASHPLMQGAPTATHDLVFYGAIPPLVWDVYTLRAEKSYVHPAATFLWRVELALRVNFARIRVEVELPLQACNQDVLLGDHSSPFPSVGSTGKTFRMRQVEWFALQP